MAKQGKRSIEQLEDEVKVRDRRIEELRKEIVELRKEIDEQRDLITRLREHADDYANCMESWKESFGMEMTEDGAWTWKPFWDQYDKLIDDYNALVRKWNKYLPLINREPRNVGRPLAASEAQVAEVRKLRKAGRSLRGIAEDTSLGLDTVRTIVGKMTGGDRTARKYRNRLERIELDRDLQTSRKRQRRVRDGLPRRARRIVEEGQALVKEAKGLGRAR
jgi:hypothetical protein